MPPDPVRVQPEEPNFHELERRSTGGYEDSRRSVGRPEAQQPTDGNRHFVRHDAGGRNQYTSIRSFAAGVCQC
jgi:hypothetical protein